MSFPFEICNGKTSESVSATRRELGAIAMDNLRRIVRALRASNAAVEREHRLSAAQLFVLRQIAERPGQSLSDLARSTLTTQSTVSEVVARLVQQGLIVRDPAPDDRRRAVLNLSVTGDEILSHAPNTVQERLVDGFRSLPADVQRSLAYGLDAWLFAAGLQTIPPTMFLEE
jgi:DNA-binding MarR family transcriptional regulator